MPNIGEAAPRPYRLVRHRRGRRLRRDRLPLRAGLGRRGARAPGARRSPRRVAGVAAAHGRRTGRCQGFLCGAAVRPRLGRVTMNGPRTSTRTVDVLVVGAAGRAGAATELARLGAGRVEVVDRERAAGGVPTATAATPASGCATSAACSPGPAYARRIVDDRGGGRRLRTPRCLRHRAGTGLSRSTPPALPGWNGCRPAPSSSRPARASGPGRPGWSRDRAVPGVYTTGELQQAVYLERQPIGRRAVVVGAEHVSFSAAVTLAPCGR